MPNRVTIQRMDTLKGVQKNIEALATSLNGLGPFTPIKTDGPVATPTDNTLAAIVKLLNQCREALIDLGVMV